MKWETVKLGDIADVFSGFAFKSADMSAESGIPLVKIKNIHNREVSENCETFLLPDAVASSKYDRFILQENDFLVAMTGQGSVGRIGRMHRVTNKYYINQRVAIVRTNKNKAVPYFVYLQVATDDNERILFNKANGAGQPNISATQIGELTVSIPNYKIQQRIVDVVKSYNDLIENNQKQIKLLEEAAQRLYKEWFIDLRFPGHESTPIHDGIPEGWRNVQLNEIDLRLESGARPKGGIDNSIQNGVPSIGAENVIGLGQYNYSSEKLIPTDFYDSMKKGKLVDRDILIYKDGAYIGRTSLFQDGFPHSTAAINEHVFLLHANDESLQYYLFFTLYQAEYYKKMQKLNKNAAQPGINTKAILSLDVLLPPISVIKRFDEIVAPIIRVLFSKAKQNHNLTEARDRLLPKLMSGEIEV